MRRAIERAAVAAMLAPLLSGCGKTLPSENAQHDVRTEARREADCANAQWKAANLGLWYNLCQTNTY
jgi:predicted small lipoprotein YifL